VLAPTAPPPTITTSARAGSSLTHGMLAHGRAGGATERAAAPPARGTYFRGTVTLTRADSKFATRSFGVITTDHLPARGRSTLKR
jgi:hypothetical protein